MSSKIVSVSIITYNHEHYIKECIECIVNQVVNFDYEIVIGQDCSTDATHAICLHYAQLYPDLISYNPRTQNLGMMGNWIETIKECTGKYIALCEGDDYWTDPYKLQKQVDFLEANEEYVACFHDITILEKDGCIVEDYITTVPAKHETIEDLARYGNYIHTPSVVFRNVIKEFPEEMKYSPIGDYFLYMLLAQHGKFKHLKETMAVYRNGVGVFSGETQEKKGVITAITLYLLSDYFNKKEDKRIEKIFFERFWLLMKQEGIMNGTINKLVISKILNLEKIPVLIRSINFYYETKIEVSEASALERYKKSVSVEYLLRWLLYKGKKKLGFVK